MILTFDPNAETFQNRPEVIATRVGRGWNVRIDGEDCTICEITPEYVKTVPYVEDEDLLDGSNRVVTTRWWDAVRELHIY